MIIVNSLTVIVCGAICLRSARDLRSNYIKAGLFGGLGLIHGLVPAMTPRHLLDPTFSNEARLFAAVYALAAVLAIAGGWAIYDHLKPLSSARFKNLLRTINTRQGKDLYKKLFWVSAMLGALGVVLKVKATGSSIFGMATAMRFAFRNEADPVLNILGIYLLNFALVPGFLGFFLSKRHRLWGIVYSIAIAVLCFVAVSKGARSLPLGLCGAILFGYFFQREMNVRRLLGFVLGGVAIGWLAISLYEVRHAMSTHDLGEVVLMALSPSTSENLLAQDPLNYNEHLVGAVECFPRQHPFLFGATYRRMLMFFIPRRFFPELKPEDTNKLFALEVYNLPVDLETTIPPTIPGDCYINFGGWLGLVVLFGYGLFFAWVSQKLQSSLLWFTAFGPQITKLLLLGMRGQPYELFVMCLFILIGTWLIAYALGAPFRSLRGHLRAQVVPHRTGRQRGLPRRKTAARDIATVSRF